MACECTTCTISKDLAFVVDKNCGVVVNGSILCSVQIYATGSETGTYV